MPEKARDVRERKGGSLAADTDKEEKKARAVSALLLIPPEIQIREKCFPVVLTTDGFIIKVELIKINFNVHIMMISTLLSTRQLWL